MSGENSSVAYADNSKSDLAEENSQSPSSTPKKSMKVQLLLRPVGDAPIAKQQKWNVDGHHDINYVSKFFRKYLKLDQDESQKSKTLVFFVNQCFAPSPDETLENIYECFGHGDSKLVLHYCLTMAWG